jgi:hypothetical protein
MIHCQMSLVTSWMPEMAVLPTPRDTTLRAASLTDFVRRISGPWPLVDCPNPRLYRARGNRGRMARLDVGSTHKDAIYIAGTIEVTLRAPKCVQHAALIFHYYVPTIA